MKARTLMFLTTIGVAALCSPVNGQTIPELARTRPTNPIVRGRLVDVQPATLDELTAGADLVLEATVTRVRSYLTADEENVLTDYQLTPTRVLAGHLPAALPVPGSSTPLILTVYGGDLTIDGFSVSVVDHSVKRPESGHRYLLFLQKFGAPGQYQLHRAGAFEVSGQELKGLVTRGDKEAFSDIVAHPYDQILSRVTMLAGRKR